MDLNDRKGADEQNDSRTNENNMKAESKDDGDESVKSFNCDSCLFDDIETKAVAFCIKCIDYLCKDCVRDHRRSRMTRTHKVLEGSELPQNPDTFKMLKSMMSCSHHPEMEVSFECKDHGTFICSNCLAVNHRKCDEVSEVCQTPRADIENFELLDLLKTVKDKNVLVRTAKEENVKLLHHDKTSVRKDRAKAIETVNKHLNLLEEHSKAETEKVFEEVLQGLQKEVTKCKEMENDATKHLELLDITTKYGNPAEFNVISKLTMQRAKVLKDYREKNDKHTVVRIQFNENKTITDMSSIGNTVICKEKKSVNDSAQNKENKSKLECSSDTVNENPVLRDINERKTRNPGTKIQNKTPLMQSKVDKTMQRYDIGESNDKSPCALSRLLLLTNGQVVVSDYSNKKIKILNLDYSVHKEYSCDGKPIDMCQTFGGFLAVLLNDRKEIYRFSRIEGNISYTNGYKTKWYPISIDGPLETEDHVVVLFPDTESNSGDKRDTEVQIRDMRDGSIIRVFTDFQQKSSLHLTLQDPWRIRKMPKSQNSYLISESSKLHCFGTLKEHENTLKEQWFFKSYKANIIDGITDIALDKDGDIYVCGKKSKNIHQIAGNHYMRNRVLLSVAETPISVCINDEQRHMVIGCEGESFIYVATFV